MPAEDRTAPARAQSRPISPARRRARSARGSFNVHAALRRFQRGKPTFADLALTADALKVPAWTLLIDGLDKHRELMAEGGLRGLETVVENYLASDRARREEIEVVARASAALSRSAARPRP